MRTKELFSVFILFCVMTCYSQPQILDSFIVNKKGKICYNENKRQSIYSGYIKAKVYQGNSQIMKKNIADIFQFIMFIQTGDYLNARKIYGEEYVTEFKQKYCLLIVKGQVQDGYPNGEWEYYDTENHLLAKIKFRKGVKNGCYVFYYPNGQILREGSFIDGKKEGIEISYDNGGIVGAIRIWKNNELINQKFTNKIFAPDHL